MNYSKKEIKTTDAVEISLSAALICVCSWIQIPSAIPFTLQAFAVFLCASLLGARKAVLSVLLYILLGAVGVPVFSGFQGGVGVLMSGTGGFIFGFLLAALIVGSVSEKYNAKFLPVFASSLLALAICYACGTLGFMFVCGATVQGALSVCVLPFVLPDTVKLIFATAVSKKLIKIKNKINRP